MEGIVLMSLQAIAGAILVLVVLLDHVPAQAADDPAVFISGVAKRTIDVLLSTRSQAEREAKFHELVDEAFDVPAIARFVLGPYWHTATDAQREEFPKLFEAYIVHVSAVRFGGYSGEQMKVTGSRPEGDKTVVRSQIVRVGNAPPVNADWRVVKTDRGLKIVDVIVEGVSLTVTEREEFSSVIQRGGGQIEVLLRELRERNGQS
jgi:phospholipid transport system substrate-binding protein